MKKKDIKKTEPKTESPLSLKDRIIYMRTALAVCQIVANDETIELLIQVNDLVTEKKGNTDIDSIVEVEHSVRSKYRPKEKKK